MKRQVETVQGFRAALRDLINKAGEGDLSMVASKVPSWMVHDLVARTCI